MESRISRSFLFCLLFFQLPLSALTVNRVNGGASIMYIDFSLAGSIPLELVRTYNSITSVNETTGWLGAFGWGWTSPFETVLTTTPEHIVLLRDGSTGNTVTFRREKEDPKLQAAFIEKVKRAYFEQIKKHALSESELKKSQLPEKILSRLKADPLYRVQTAQKYRISGAIPKGEMLISSEFGYQTLTFRGNQWIREKDGVTQVFDKAGRLVRQIDKNGALFNFKYSSVTIPQLVEISDPDRTMSLKFSWRQERIVEVIDNRSQRARYTYDNNSNLISVTDSNNQTYVYKYDNKRFQHLLTKIEYPTESSASNKVYRELQYDDNGMVTAHRDKDGTEFSYVYGKSTTDPENNFWTKTTRKRGGIAEEQYDEFFVKARPDGSKYLYKQDSRTAGIATTTLYTACCAKPQQIVRNGEVTNFKYSDEGLLIERVGPNEDIRIEYDRRWKKVSNVTQNSLVSKFEYDNRGNLIKASNTKNEKVLLKYDKLGRIQEISDGHTTQLSFKYNDMAKPIWISQKGIGTIKIDYDIEGKVLRTQTLVKAPRASRVPSENVSKEIIRTVMKSFQTLLDTLRPAGITMNAGLY